jgi:hypothetical protein
MLTTMLSLRTSSRARRVTFLALAALACASLLAGCTERRTMGRTGTDGGPIGTDGGPTGTDGGPIGTDGGPIGTDGGPIGTDGGPIGTDGGPGGVTIGMIQRGMIATSTVVTVRNVVVTAVYSTGVWVQDPAGGSMYSGIRVYAGAAPTVAVNDRVDVMGTYIEYFDDSEIESATITRLGAGTPIAPVSVSAATAATEPYEGVLVRVTGSVTDTAYDCSLDNASCFDTDLWEIGGAAGVVAYDFVYQSADWASRIGTVPVTGVMSWRYDRRRLMPRTSSDF